jgi:hypothetical protein
VRARRATLAYRAERFAAATARKELAVEPVLSAAILNTIGQVYSKLGAFDQAEPLLAESVAISARGPRRMPRSATIADAESLAAASKPQCKCIAVLIM